MEARSAFHIYELPATVSSIIPFVPLSREKKERRKRIFSEHQDSVRAPTESGLPFPPLAMSFPERSRASQNSVRDPSPSLLTVMGANLRNELKAFEGRHETVPSCSGYMASIETIQQQLPNIMCPFPSSLYAKPLT